jgi:hypothetical protein
VFPFGVRARSLVDEDASAVVEGDVEIGKVFGLQAKLVPVTSTGRWRGRHVVQLSNWGNAPARLRVVATDPDAALGFLLRPDVVDLALGGHATVRVTVRTRKPFLRGTPVRLPFQITGERTDAAPTGPTPAFSDPGRPVVDGALVQKPILTRAFVTALALGLVVVGAGAAALTREHDFVDLGAAPVAVTASPTGPGSPGSSPTASTVGPTQSTVGPTQSTVGPTESTIGPTQSTTGPTGSTVGPTQSTIGPTDSTTGPTTGPKPPGDPLLGGVWIAGAHYEIQTANTLQNAIKLAERLRTERGLPSGYLDSTRYPALKTALDAPPSDFFLTYAGPYATKEEASAACVPVQATTQFPWCYVWQPDPPPPPPPSVSPGAPTVAPTR